MSQEQDRVFFRNYSIVIGLIVVAMVVFYVIANAIGGRDESNDPARAARVEANTKPAGAVQVAGEAPAAPAPEATAVAAADTGAAPTAGADAGKQTYDGLCVSCHGSGLPNVPQFGDKAAWEPRIAKGVDALYASAISGFTGASGMPMPARGGNPSLSDDQVRAAVDYMVSSAR
jgi:cytochrome c5